MHTPGGGPGKYSALKEAHERISAERASANGREMTDMRVERSSRDAAKASKPAPAIAERSAPHPPPSADVPRTVCAGYIAPAPGGTQAHAVWRSLMTRRIAHEKEAEDAREADRIPRILRTEKSPIHQASELNVAKARTERPQGHDTEKTTSVGNEQDVEPER